MCGMSTLTRRRHRTKPFTVRLTPEERQLFDAAAEASDRSTGRFLVAAARPLAHEILSKVNKQRGQPETDGQQPEMSAP